MAGPKMKLEDWLDDLCVRFIINLPQEDLSSVARICFQVEEAQWFYEDFVRPLDPTLPSMSLRTFCLRIFQHCPLLAPFSVENHTKAFEEFLQYKTRIPVRGAIMLNHAMDKAVLVKGWKKGANWSFPRGKINKDEDDLDCAIREVYEETGLDLRAAGLVPSAEDVKYIEISMREQQMRLYIFRDVPEDTHFEPRTRKEISKIQWYKLSELPAFRKKSAQSSNEAAAVATANKFYMVAPFLVPLRKWVSQQRKKDAVRAQSHLTPGYGYVEDVPTEDDGGTQTETAVEPIANTPALDTLEGATRELRRLLQVQPPTQGLQVNPPSSPSAADKGGALLALLQSRGVMPPSRPSLPYTPLGNTITNAPQPDTPHGQHHPTQKSDFSSYQQPPPFPIATGNGSRPSHSWTSQQGYQSGAISHHAQDRRIPQTQQTVPYSNQVQRHPDHAQQTPLDRAGLLPPQHGRGQPALQHPQPLPPQVQASLLAQGVLPEPLANAKVGAAANAGLPDTAMFSGAGSGGHVMQYNQHNEQGSVRNMKSPNLNQLDSHTAALLSAFKSGGSGQPAAVDSKPAAPSYPPGHITQPAQHSATAALQSQLVSHQGYYSQTTYQPPSGATGPGSLPQSVPESSVGSMGTKSPLLMDQQRSALLGIFRTAGSTEPLGFSGSSYSQRPTTDAGLNTARPMSGNPRGGASGMSTVPNLDAQLMSNLSLQAKSPLHAGSALNDGLIPLSLQKAGGFSSRDLFAAASPPRSEQRQVPPQSKLYPNPEQGGDLASGMRMPQVPPLQHPATEAASPYARLSPRAPPSGLSGGVPNPAAFPMPSGLGRRPEPSVEQKQKLLSLFGTPQGPSMAGHAADGRTKGKESGVFDAQPLSRVASMASGSSAGGGAGGLPPRRDGEAPISSRDREFLMGYLENVAKSAGRH